MAAPRLLPPTNELVRFIEAGLTHQQIADRIREETGVVVSRSTVSVALSRAGMARDAMRYKEELPWRVKASHLTQYPARMLRLLGRKRSGMRLNDDEADRLEAWLEGMQEKGLVVAYVPQGEGFIYVEADEVGDNPAGIPIRRRPIDLEELDE